jgi:hypothetical protein
LGAVVLSSIGMAATSTADVTFTASSTTNVWVGGNGDFGVQGNWEFGNLLLKPNPDQPVYIGPFQPTLNGFPLDPFRPGGAPVVNTSFSFPSLTVVAHDGPSGITLNGGLFSVGSATIGAPVGSAPFSDTFVATGPIQDSVLTLSGGDFLGSWNFTENSRIDFQEDYVVRSNKFSGFPTVNVAADTTVTIDDGATLELSGESNVAGMMALGSTPNSGLASILEIEGPTSFTGGGEIVLVDQDSRIVNGGGNLPDDELINVDNTIRGQGFISATITNQSVIRAEGGLLAIQNIGNGNPGSGLDNSQGVFEVASDGILSINNLLQASGAVGDLHIEEGGRVFASDLVDVNLTGPGPLVIEAFDNFPTFSGLNFLPVQMAGTIHNPGTITFSSNPNSNVDATLKIEGPTSFTGGGEIVLVDQDSRIVNGGGNLPDDELINVDNTIRGQGFISATITNQSVIRAEGGLLQVSRSLTQSVSGYLEAAAGATLEIMNTNEFNPYELNDGTIGGSGTINGFIVNRGATVAPGSSPGTLTIDGDYTHDGEAELVIEIGGTSPGEFDVLHVLGDVNLLGGSLELVFVEAEFLIPVGTQFDILVASNIVGSFDDIVLPTDASGAPRFSTQFNESGLVSVTALSDIQVIPEPTAMMALAIGGAGLMLRRRRLA